MLHSRAVPTSRKRHSITETDRVAAVLDQVRAEDPGGRVDLSELVILGGEEKLRRLREQREDDERRLKLRLEFLERTRTAKGIDVDALIEAHEHGWTHE